MMTERIQVPSGLVIPDPLDRLIRFCEEEYEYYDAVPTGAPDRIEPVDLLATVGINSRLDTAVKVRTAHRVMRDRCEPILALIGSDANLLTFPDLDSVYALLVAAMEAKYVLLATATKVLHRKRPSLIPVLDSVVVAHYLRAQADEGLLQRSWSERSAALDAARVAIPALRNDLAQVGDALEILRDRLAARGFPLSSVRILDILAWTELEPSGSYR